MTLLFDDSFNPQLNDTSRTSFGDHGPVVGHGWRQHPQYAGIGLPIFDTSGRLYHTGTFSIMWYGLPVVPLPADVDLEVTFDVLSLIATFPSICGWVDEVANTMIYARADIAANTVRLSKLAAGAASELTTGAHTWGVANDQKIKLKLRSDATAAVEYNGVEIIAPFATGVATPGGRHGFRLATGGAASTGIHIKRVTATDLTGSTAATPPRRSGFLKRQRGFGYRSITPVPTQLQQRNSCNTVCFTQDQMWTHNNVQYAVWVNEEHKPVVGKRQLPAGRWTTFDLSTVAANPLASPTREDPHHNFTVAVSADGHVHVMGNMHADPLHYVKTQTPGDITSFAAGTLTGLNETAITYPQFVKCSDGTLLLFYRAGVSGAADEYLNTYNSGAGTWSQIGKILDGATAVESPYLYRVGVSPVDGAIHAFMTWRSSGASADTNNDITHMYSVNKGVTWKRLDTGATLTLPVTHAAILPALDTAATGSGLINQGGADVDTAGRPHVVVTLYDGNGKTQLNHIYWNGSAWVKVVETAFTYRQDLTSATIKELGRPAVLCDSSGRTFMLYRHNVDRPGRLMLQDITPGVTKYPEFSVWNTSLYDSEITFDSQALRDRNELHMVVAPCAPGNQDQVTLTARYFQSVTGFVVSMPMGAARSLSGS